MAILQVKLEETVNLNGKSRGSSTTTVVDGITRVYHEIINPVAERRIFTFGTAGTGDAAGNFISSDVEYLRVTNIGDTNNCTIRVVGTSESYVADLQPTASYILFNDQMDAFTGATAATDTIALADIEYVTASGNTEVEVFVAASE